MASINLGRVQGYSAYEIAVQNGYSGTEVEWLASLKGTNGTNGTNGTDGVSPVASVERNLADTGAVITITDATGTTTATVYDGETPSLTGYATETYVDNAVGAIDVPTATSDLTNDSGFITSSDLSGYAQTSSLATVATSGDYDDLTNKPTIPDVSDLATETYVDNAVAGITVPTAISDLTNDSGFVTANDLATVATSGDYDDLTNKPTIPAAPGIATAQTAGLVKPDGTTITIDANGTISSASSGNSVVYDAKQNIIQIPVTGDSSNIINNTNWNKDNAIFGYDNRITGSMCATNIIGGYGHRIDGYGCLVVGSNNKLQDINGQIPQYSIVGGTSVTAKGQNSIVIGSYVKGENNNQAIFGRYNSDTTSPLVVGIGTSSSAKADGFKVTSAGNGVFAGTVQATDFLDSNGDSIVGGGGDSLPTINSGDAGKALVVNSGETGVEWATVGGGSAPVDPAHSNKNVYTGAGTFASAWTTVMGSDRTDDRTFDFSENPIQIDDNDNTFSFTGSGYIPDDTIQFDLEGNREVGGGEQVAYSGMLHKTSNNEWITNDGWYTLSTSNSGGVWIYVITQDNGLIESRGEHAMAELTSVNMVMDELKRTMAGAEFAGDFPLPIGQKRWRDNGETERTLSIGLDEITLTDNHCAESPYNVERVEETNSISISAAEGVTYTWENHNDLSSASVSLIKSGLVFNTSDGRGTDETFIWEVNGIQLKDQTTGDIYHLSIDNGQIVLTNNSQ